VTKAVWCNDIHLDFLGGDDIDRFLDSIVEHSPGAVLLGGDISTARQIEEHLGRIEEAVQAPVYFVLGNHDFYHGSIADVRKRVGRMCSQSERLHWLNDAGVCPLTEKTAVVGHDGWGDARLGNYMSSPVELNDFYLIQELIGRTREDLVRVLRQLGDEAATHFQNVLPEALASYPNVIVVTHVPPFRESTWYDGEVSGDDWLPFFCGKAAGDVLREVMSRYPDNELTVLCGHTHGEGEVGILPNLRVVTGGARYGAPKVRSIPDIV
jgi:predicted phosphohydrolase